MTIIFPHGNFLSTEISAESVTNIRWMLLRCIVTREFPDGQRDLVKMEITKLILHLEVSLSRTLQYIQQFPANYFQQLSFQTWFRLDEGFPDHGFQHT